VRDILDRIGDTSMLELRRVVPDNGARILLKLEDGNPTGSMKDRMALAMIEAAEADGRLTPDGSVVEYTGGSTGVSLSLICAVKGYPLHVVTSDAFAAEKVDHMRILGAELTIVQSDSGRMTEKLTKDMVAAASRIVDDTGGFWTDQLNNTDQLAAYRKLAEEIRGQTGGRIDAFVQSVGTAACLRGVAEGLRGEDVRIVAVEPAESAVLSGGPTGAHKIDGVGAGFVVPLWHDDIADEIEQGLHGGRDGHGVAAGPRRRALRRDLHRRQRHRRAAPGGPARARCHHRDAHVRHGHEVPPHLRVAKMRAAGEGLQTAYGRCLARTGDLLLC
jgi:cysteine synthase